jgi:hypothetical protein
MRVAAVCLVASLAGLIGCQDKHGQATAPASSATMASAAPANEPARPAEGAEQGLPGEVPPLAVIDTTPVDTQVVEVKLADKSDGKILTGLMTDQFKPNDGVFIAIDTRGTADKYTLSSKWLTPTGDTLTEYSQEIHSAGANETIFSLSKPDGWSKGQYHVELSINGKPMRTVAFTVR